MREGPQPILADLKGLCVNRRNAIENDPACPLGSDKTMN